MKIDQYKYISEQDFDGIWGAHYNSRGHYYDPDELVGVEIHNIWTVYEDTSIDESGFSDYTLYATPGIVSAFALGYVVTDMAWCEGTNDAIWYLDDDEEAAEERRLDNLKCISTDVELR